MTTQGSANIISMAFHLPSDKSYTKEICQQEGLDDGGLIKASVDVEEVHIFNGEWKSDLAIKAAKECLAKAATAVDGIDVIVDFSSLPEDYVVPSWCMSNRIQHELGATRAFTIGFGGGGTTNLLVALRFVLSLIRLKEINTALLVSSDVALPGNRVINPDKHLTILGDGGSALLVGRRHGLCEILDIGLWCDGSQHAVFNILGGGLANPDRLDLYNVRIAETYDLISVLSNLKMLVHEATHRVGLNTEDFGEYINPNISAEDRRALEEMLNLSTEDPFGAMRRQYGHVQGSDLVINLLNFLKYRSVSSSEYVMVCSHGWGFQYGTMIVRA